MTDSDLRELDEWIAEKFLNWFESGERWWRRVSNEEDSRYWSPIGIYDFRPTVEAISFALVKREIERRGWSWTCQRNSARRIPNFTFEIYNKDYFRIGYGQSPNYEELAGCLAVKSAVETNK